jgi:hypothetical protein
MYQILRIQNKNIGKWTLFPFLAFSCSIVSSGGRRQRGGQKDGGRRQRGGQRDGGRRQRGGRILMLMLAGCQV